jgi:DNA-binding XRE family transcriptional regulator
MMPDSSPTTMTGHDLRQWRIERGMSQTQLAHALDVPKDTISRWERDALGIRHGRILALALDALALSLKEPASRHGAET